MGGICSSESTSVSPDSDWDGKTRKLSKKKRLERSAKRIEYLEEFNTSLFTQLGNKNKEWEKLQKLTDSQNSYIAQLLATIAYHEAAAKDNEARIKEFDFITTKDTAALRRRDSRTSKEIHSYDWEKRMPDAIADQLYMWQQRAKRGWRMTKQGLNLRDRTSEGRIQKIRLPRGGYYVWTKVGAIQFGIPPETIKDSMNMGLDVPTIFVVPQERFDSRTGVSASEIEFPTFFNFFVLRKPVTLLTDKASVKNLMTIMKEAFEGPDPENLFIDEEFSQYASEKSRSERPDHQKELDHFRQTSPGKFMEISDMINFVFFDETGTCDLGESVVIKKNILGYTIRQGSEHIASLLERDISTCNYPESFGTEDSSEPDYSSTTEDNDDDDSEKQSKTTPDEQSTDTPLKITLGDTNVPRFGVTVLGSSHGFDPSGSTSGFVVWINGQGVMIDPPPHSGQLLRRYGIQPKLITALILTHCHADHDAGTMQKIVTEDKITLMTTKTIFNSLLRKYCGVSGLGEEFLAALVDFHPVCIDEPIHFGGAVFRFFYSLHSVPCVGFELTYLGKRFAYSSDTFFEPTQLKQINRNGVLSDGRLSSLLNFPWDCDLVFHEAGVPPIHTPLSAFETVPIKYRENIQLIHIGMKERKEAEKLGLKVCKVGVENTTVLVEGVEMNNTLRVLFLLSKLQMFKNMTSIQLLEVFHNSKITSYVKGNTIIEAGKHADFAFLVVSGSVIIENDVSKKCFSCGDFFGDRYLVLNEPYNIPVICESDCVLFEVDKFVFNYLYENVSAFRQPVLCLINGYKDGSWRAISRNNVLKNLTTAQRTNLQSIMTIQYIEEGDNLVNKGEPVQGAYLVLSGELIVLEVHSVCRLTPLQAAAFTEADDEDDKNDSTGENMDGLPSLCTGAFICDYIGLRESENSTITLSCDSEKASVFYISREHMLRYLDDNPLMVLTLLKTMIVF